HEFTAMLDTGASITTLSMREAQAAFNLTPDSPDVEKGELVNGDPNIKAYFHRFKTLTFEGITVGNPRVELIPDLMRDRLERAPETGSRLATPGDDDTHGLPAMLIGYSTLKHLHVYIAYKEQKLYITPASAPAPAASAPPPAPAH
ncbi:MAG TPA: retropepsin-like aspartic protease, partial [Rhizomicrobium sp.]|nr:retropepsin-like aspartic protease [Rhizomicrobium sp.]